MNVRPDPAVDLSDSALLALPAPRADAPSHLLPDAPNASLTRSYLDAVGGYPFVVAPELWRQIGADGSAGDAQAAIALANQLRNAA